MEVSEYSENKGILLGPELLEEVAWLFATGLSYKSIRSKLLELHGISVTKEQLSVAHQKCVGRIEEIRKDLVVKAREKTKSIEVRVSDSLAENIVDSKRLLKGAVLQGFLVLKKLEDGSGDPKVYGTYSSMLKTNLDAIRLLNELEGPGESFKLDEFIKKVNNGSSLNG